MKTIESDEIVGHVPEFLPDVLAAMMQPGEIASVDAVAQASPKMPPRVYGCFEEEMKNPVFTR